MKIHFWNQGVNGLGQIQPLLETDDKLLIIVLPIFKNEVLWFIIIFILFEKVFSASFTNIVSNWNCDEKFNFVSKQTFSLKFFNLKKLNFSILISVRNHETWINYSRLYKNNNHVK